MYESSLFTLHQSSCITSTRSPSRTMKVTPVKQKGISGNNMTNPSKADQYFVFGIHTLARCLGLSPYKMNKETGELSFRYLPPTQVSWLVCWSLTLSYFHCVHRPQDVIYCLQCMTNNFQISFANCIFPKYIFPNCIFPKCIFPKCIFKCMYTL